MMLRTIHRNDNENVFYLVYVKNKYMVRLSKAKIGPIPFHLLTLFENPFRFFLVYNNLDFWWLRIQH